MSRLNKHAFPDNVIFIDEAIQDAYSLDGSIADQVAKAIKKVSTNPKPSTEGGLGKPLSGNLSGFQKIKLLSAGVRVIYKHIREGDKMKIIIISMRADNEAYVEAEKRIEKYGL